MICLAKHCKTNTFHGSAGRIGMVRWPSVTAAGGGDQGEGANDVESNGMEVANDLELNGIEVA